MIAEFKEKVEKRYNTPIGGLTSGWYTKERELKMSLCFVLWHHGGYKTKDDMHKALKQTLPIGKTTMRKYIADAEQNIADKKDFAYLVGEMLDEFYAIAPSGN